MMQVLLRAFHIHISGIPFVSESRNTVNTPVDKNSEFISCIPLRRRRYPCTVPVRSPHRSEKGILLFSSVRPLSIFYLYCMDVSMLSSNLLVVYAQQFTNKTFRFYIKHTTKKDLDDVFVPTSSKSFLFYIIFSSITFSIRLFTSSASSVVCISLYSS